MSTLCFGEKRSGVLGTVLSGNANQLKKAVWVSPYIAAGNV